MLRECTRSLNDLKQTQSQFQEDNQRENDDLHNEVENLRALLQTKERMLDDQS